MRKNKNERENETMKIVFYTQTSGRIYVEGKWIANFYVDKNGNRHVI